MKKVIPIILLSLWTLFFAIGIISNMSHYKVADWIVIILIAIIPYVIYFIVKFNRKKRQINSASSKSAFSNINNYEEEFYTNYDNTIQAVQTKTTFEHNNNIANSNINGTSKSDTDIPDFIKKINNDYQNLIKTEDSYKSGKQNIFTDNTFSEEEQRFFECVYGTFQNAGLKSNLIKLDRLSTGTFNVDYITEGYIGKIQISETKEKFRVIRQGAKRASKIFDTLNETEQYINEKSDYYIEHKKVSIHTICNILLGKKLMTATFLHCKNLLTQYLAG